VRQLTFQRVIGSGAVGTVYLAELVGSRGFRRTVAVKVLLTNQPDQEMFLSRVRDEARLLGLLHDEHILRVLELVRIGERDGVVMEYVEGVDLAALVAEGNRPPARALAELGGAIAGALHAAHTARHPSSGEPLNVVHRDVKPANVMLTDRGGVKLLDFGIAQARFAARESRTGQFVLGTLNYMAPEYIITGEVSPAADVYGLGLTLWEAAVGEVFGQPKLKADAHARRVDERLSRLAQTHAALEPFLRPMLAFDPAARPRADVVERELVAAADGLAGTGLRSWAAKEVPLALRRRTEQARDTVGLAGSTVTVADGADLEVSGLGRSNAGAPAELPEEYTLLRVERPAFLDAPSPPPPAPAPAREPAPPPPGVPAARPLPPRAPPPTLAAPAVAPAPAPLAPAPRAAAKAAARPKGNKGGTSVFWIVAQGLMVGGFFGLALVAAVGVYLFFNRGGS